MDVIYTERWFKIVDFDSSLQDPRFIKFKYDFGNGVKTGSVVSLPNQTRQVLLEEGESHDIDEEILQGIDWLLKVANR